MKKVIFFLLSLLIFLSLSKPAQAVVNPAESSNNIFGIHIHDEGDLEDAVKLVNSSGGDWGYVTIVIRKDDRNTQKWQETFNKMRRLHLIPILRIATRQLNGGWEKPSFDEIDGWVSFLNNLNWVVSNRYVIIGNEPNHAKEWGDELNPEEYAEYLHRFSKRLKDISNEFYILPAALDASAPTDKFHMDEYVFVKRMMEKNPNVFEYIEGWNSHSYPNPNFSALATKTGRGSVKTYEWELDFLENLGINRKLPVFITETGWAHNKNEQNGYLSTMEVSDRYKKVFEEIWKKDPIIIAVTPFILNYQESPFDKFSWKISEGNFYEFYYRVMNIVKNDGVPVQNQSLEIIAALFPKVLNINNNSYGIAYAKNTGQAIWENGNVYEIYSGDIKVKIQSFYPDTMEPGQSGLIYYSKENIN